MTKLLTILILITIQFSARGMDNSSDCLPEVEEVYPEHYPPHISRSTVEFQKRIFNQSLTKCEELKINPPVIFIDPSKTLKDNLSEFYADTCEADLLSVLMSPALNQDGRNSIFSRLDKDRICDLWHYILRHNQLPPDEKKRLIKILRESCLPYEYNFYSPYVRVQDDDISLKEPYRDFSVNSDEFMEGPFRNIEVIAPGYVIRNIEDVEHYLMILRVLVENLETNTIITSFKFSLPRVVIAPGMYKDLFFIQYYGNLKYPLDLDQGIENEGADLLHTLKECLKKNTTLTAVDMSIKWCCIPTSSDETREILTLGKEDFHDRSNTIVASFLNNLNAHPNIKTLGLHNTEFPERSNHGLLPFPNAIYPLYVIGPWITNNTTITSLNLEDNYLCDYEVCEIFKGLKRNSTLTRLDLRNNAIREQSPYIRDSFKEDKDDLELQDNDVREILMIEDTQEFFDIIADEDEPIIVREEDQVRLKYQRNLYRERIIEALTHNTTLKHLNVGSWYLPYYVLNRMLREDEKFEGMYLIFALSDVLESNANSSLKTIVFHQLGDYDLNPSPAQVLFRALKTNSTLKTLDLSHCGLNESHITGLSDVVSMNTTLTSLRLSKNLISLSERESEVYPQIYEGWKALFSSLQKNSTLTELDLFESWFNDDCIGVLVPLLQNNATLRCLNLGTDGHCASYSDQREKERGLMTAKGLNSLVTALNNNTTLNNLNLSGLRWITDEIKKEVMEKDKLKRFKF